MFVSSVKNSLVTARPTYFSLCCNGEAADVLLAGACAGADGRSLVGGSAAEEAPTTSVEELRPVSTGGAVEEVPATVEALHPVLSGAAEEVPAMVEASRSVLPFSWLGAFHTPAVGRRPGAPGATAPGGSVRGELGGAGAAAMLPVVLPAAARGLGVLGTEPPRAVLLGLVALGAAGDVGAVVPRGVALEF